MLYIYIVALLAHLLLVSAEGDYCGDSGCNNCNGFYDEDGVSYVASTKIANAIQNSFNYLLPISTDLANFTYYMESPHSYDRYEDTEMGTCQIVASSNAVFNASIPLTWGGGTVVDVTFNSNIGFYSLDLVTVWGYYGRGLSYRGSEETGPVRITMSIVSGVKTWYGYRSGLRHFTHTASGAQDIGSFIGSYLLYTRVTFYKTKGTSKPTKQPTTLAPTKVPTTAPPTLQPTLQPTLTPTTRAPTTLAPSRSPTSSKPTISPTVAPTKAPTKMPTRTPTKSPTAKPTMLPTASPTNKPTVDTSLITNTRSPTPNSVDPPTSIEAPAQYTGGASSLFPSCATPISILGAVAMLLAM